jgi:hypothetical protein
VLNSLKMNLGVAISGFKILNLCALRYFILPLNHSEDYYYY